MTLKLRAPVPFPANVEGDGGIAVTKQNGVWTIEPDFSALSAVIATAATNPSAKQIWIYDPQTGEYNVLTLAGLGDALFKATSVTSLAIATGSAVFATQSGKDFAIGSFVLATSDADATDYMYGQVTAYSGTQLTVDVQETGGSGTHADWTIRIAGVTGPQGEQGPAGDMSGANNLSELTNKATARTNLGVAIGTDVQAFDADLTALAGLSSTGIIARTGAGTAASRTLTGTANKITVTNGDGVSGNPTLTAGSDILDKTASATLAAGYSATSFSAGTKSSGTFTPDPANGNFQHATNGGAHTLAPPTSVCTMIVEYTNNGSAGAVTTSGFTKVSGDSFNTTNANKFLCFITKTQNYSHLHVQALQ
jgi:hypothetical protein